MSVTGVELPVMMGERDGRFFLVADVLTMRDMPREKLEKTLAFMTEPAEEASGGEQVLAAGIVFALLAALHGEHFQRDLEQNSSPVEGKAGHA